jgi:hypothetical protein
VDTFVTLHQRHLVAVRVDPVQGHFNPTYKIEVFLEDGGQACRHEDDVTLLRKPADVGKNTPPDCVPQLVVVDTSAGVERCCRVDQEVVIYLTWGFVGGKECFDFFENGILALFSVHLTVHQMHSSSIPNASIRSIQNCDDTRALIFIIDALRFTIYWLFPESNTK